MIKKCLLLLCALAVHTGSLAACGEIPDGASVSAVGTVSQQPGMSAVISGEESDGIWGEYLSTEGDGEILCLYDDGTFLGYTVTELSAEGENGSVPFSMTEQVSGVYVCEGGELRLSIREISYSVLGLEEYPELVEQQADALAGADAELHALYVKLFGGAEVDGAELLGEENMAKLTETEVLAVLDEEKSTFTYKRNQAS